MAASSAGLHEPEDRLSTEAIDEHRALVSLMEELEAVDWYRQRAEATEDTELAGILVHNRDEEKEHAAMVLEWLRRRDPMLDQHLRTYLFTSGSILEREAAAGGGGAPGSLNIGDLRNRES
ncbi:MAG TPA: encapsulin-associated ferritin-like protein [Acidimicrobiales bacterium]|nr:encapsulin-associated ferritin-like protein [Acidimicrobiales bacterium]